MLTDPGLTDPGLTDPGLPDPGPVEMYWARSPGSGYGLGSDLFGPAVVGLAAG
jgi:hypothetical protein